jgi:hypothetical protein
MALDARQAFKVAALARMVEDGLSPEAMLDTVKSGREKIAGLLGYTVSAAGNIGKSAIGAAAGWGVPMALAAPPVAGGLAGFALAKGTDIDDTDIDDIKDRELIDEYQRRSHQLWRNKAVRNYDSQKKKTGRIFL